MIHFYLPHKTDDEEIMIIVRRHIFIFLLHVSLWIFLAILPIILYSLATIFSLELDIPATVFNMGIFIASIYYLYIFLFAFHSFVDYYLDVWIVTNKRIVSIKQNGLFSRTVAELHLPKVQDITYDVNGFTETVLNYGHVYIQSAGESQRFQFEQVPNPREVSEKINKIIHNVSQQGVAQNVVTETSSKDQANNKI